MATIAETEQPAVRRTISHPARLLYAILAVEFLVSLSLALAFGFRTSTAASFLPQFYCLLLVACGPLARRIDRPRLGGACETVGFLYGQGFALVALIYPMTAIAAPFADAQLASADRALGFDWLKFAALFRDHPALLKSLTVIYFSFGWQGAVLLPALFLARRGDRGWVLIYAANFALLLTMLIYPLSPAEGAFIHYGLEPSDYPNLEARVPWSFGPAIHAIRDGGARIITRELMAPFVSFPSYHAAAAVLLAWAAWPIKTLRWPFLILNVAMAISALIIGAHYLIDLIAGAAVAAFGLTAAALVLARVRSPA